MKLSRHQLKMIENNVQPSNIDNQKGFDVDHYDRVLKPSQIVTAIRYIKEISQENNEVYAIYLPSGYHVDGLSETNTLLIFEGSQLYNQNIQKSYLI